LIRNDKLEARQIFLFHFKGTPSQDQQKPFRRRLITFKVTLTGQGHFTRSHQLRKVTPCTQESVSPPPEGGMGHSLLRLRGQGVPIRMTEENALHSVYIDLCTKGHKIRKMNTLRGHTNSEH
jgi:hypothetical protein